MGESLCDARSESAFNLMTINHGPDIRTSRPFITDLDEKTIRRGKTEMQEQLATVLVDR